MGNLTDAVPELAGATVDKSSLTGARVRLGAAAMAEVFHLAAADPVALANTPGARWRGRLVLAVDGFVVDLPETVDNRRVFGGPVGGVRSTRDTAYPQAKVVTLAEAGSHGLRAAAIGAYATPERELAEQLIGALDEHSIVLFDAGFPSVRLFQLLQATGAAVVMRADRRIGNRDLT
ncbi:transposase, partial [Catenulispora rubra]|uniref:transposase n=1 Tax=Catenulispora rubra TaxID=280293 RepID=UPI0022653A4C